MKLQEIKDTLGADTISKKGTVITVRKSFFYTGGFTPQAYVTKVLAAFPGAKIIDSGEIWRPFRGGASVAQSSHWYVKFELPVSL